MKQWTPAIGTPSAIAKRVTLSNLSNPAAVLPLNAVASVGTSQDAAGSQTFLQQSTDFIKLFESLIAGEVVSRSPTQIHEPDEADPKTAKPQKNPKDSSDSASSNGQDGDSLVAMMAATSIPIKPMPIMALSLDFGRSAEDRFVDSPTSKEEQSAVILPDNTSGQVTVVPVMPQVGVLPIPIGRADFPNQSRSFSQVQIDQAPIAQDRVDHKQIARPPIDQDDPATEPEAVRIGAQAPPLLNLPLQPPSPPGGPARERSSASDRPRPSLELPTGSRQAPDHPRPLGKVRTETSPSTEPIAFAARLTEQDKLDGPQTIKRLPIPDTQKQSGPAPTSQSEPQAMTDPENVPSSKHVTRAETAPPPPTDPATGKPKPVLAENPTENVPTAPKPSLPIALAPLETPPHGQPNSTKTASAPEVKQSSAAQQTELQSKPTIRSEPAREISIRIPSTAGSGNVDVQIVERDGKVQVTVRGSDNQLNSALRSDLTELVHALDQKGYKTETWTPADTYPLTSGRGPEVQTPGRSESSPDWSGNQQPGGGDQGNPGGHQQQRRQQQERPDWLIELERRLDREG